MSDNVVTMSGTKYQTVGDLADWLKREYEDGNINHVVMVVQDAKNYSDVVYDRQTHGDIVFASAVLQSVAIDMAGQSLPEEDDVS